jgi:hypothetical protein
MAKDAEQVTLRESPYVHKAAQVASITHGWKNNEQNKAPILNLGVLIGTSRPTPTGAYCRRVKIAATENGSRGILEGFSKGISIVFLSYRVAAPLPV